MTAPTAPRQALELLAELRREAASLLREHEGGQLHEYGAGMTGVLDALEPALRAQAEAAAGEITWDAAVERLTISGNHLVLTARGDGADLLAVLLRDAAEKIEEGTLEHHDEACGYGLWFRAALAQAGGEG